MINTANILLASFPLTFNTQILAYALVVLATVGQTLINLFLNVDPATQARRFQNQFMKEEEARRKKQPNKGFIPLPPNKKQDPDKDNVINMNLNRDKDNYAKIY